MTDQTATGNGNRRTRRKLLTLLAVAVLIGLLVFAVWELLMKRPSEETDNAYISGDVVAITARSPGTVIAIYADDTERVRPGQPLVDLDPATADVELAAAAARLGQVVRDLHAGFAAVDSASAEVAQAQTGLAKARDDLRRRQQAATAGAVSGEEVAHAAETVKTATAALALAQSRQAQAEAQVRGTTVHTNPAVLAAIADYRRAAIRRSHMQITAPLAGTVAKRSVQIGQQIGAGAPLMAVVPLSHLWIDANFRETQLAEIRVGQPVRITTDIYGGKVVFHGNVLGVGAGSGSAFALLPAQNATGNWIKITQRLPVRISLKSAELEKYPLRIGLSAKVEVDTSDTSGSPLGHEAHQPVVSQPSLDPDVEADITRIIAANSAGNRARNSSSAG